MQNAYRYLAIVPLLLSGCQDAAGPVIADVAYQVTCTGTPGANCVPSMITGRKWDYVQEDGKEVVDGLGTVLGTLNARCRASGVAPGILQLSMRAEVDGEYIEIDGLRLNEDDGSFAGGTCRVTVFDGDNLYGGSTIGVCSDATPTSATPCQVTSSTFDRDASDGPSVELRMFCTQLGNASQPSSQVSLRDSQAAANPAIIRFANCSGL